MFARRFVGVFAGEGRGEGAGLGFYFWGGVPGFEITYSVD